MKTILKLILKIRVHMCGSDVYDWLVVNYSYRPQELTAVKSRKRSRVRCPEQLKQATSHRIGKMFIFTHRENGNVRRF